VPPFDQFHIVEFAISGVQGARMIIGVPSANSFRCATSTGGPPSEAPILGTTCTVLDGVVVLPESRPLALLENSSQSIHIGNNRRVAWDNPKKTSCAEAEKHGVATY